MVKIALLFFLCLITLFCFFCVKCILSLPPLACTQSYFCKCLLYILQIVLTNARIALCPLDFLVDVAARAAFAHEKGAVGHDGRFQ